jgi:hypothetical protein
VPNTIFWKTDAGREALKLRTGGLSQKQRSAFILINGERSIDDILKATGGIGVVFDDIQSLVDQGFIGQKPKPTADADAADDSGFSSSRLEDDYYNSVMVLPQTQSEQVAQVIEVLTDQERFARAYPIAVRLTSELGLRGFRLNLAVESAGDLDQLIALLPKLREAVGLKKVSELNRALGIS